MRRSSPQRLCILGMSRREAFPSLGALVVVTTGSAKTCSISFFCEWVCETGWNFNVALVFIVILILLSFIRLTLSCLSGTNVLSPLELALGPTRLSPPAFGSDPPPLTNEIQRSRWSIVHPPNGVFNRSPGVPGYPYGSNLLPHRISITLFWHVSS